MLHNKSNGLTMSPKRRYQCSSLNFGIASQPPSAAALLLGDGDSCGDNVQRNNLPNITSAEIAVSPCITFKKVGSTSKRNPAPGGVSFPSTPYQGEKEITVPPQYGRPRSTAAPSIHTKGNKTYRVRHHHQNHYEPLNNSSFNTLSQGVFGLPLLNEYLPSAVQPTSSSTPASAHPAPSMLWDFEELGGTKLSDYSPPPELSNYSSKVKEIKPRMKTTLPSSLHTAAAAALNTMSSSSTSAQRPATPPLASSLYPQSHLEEEMDGILQVRPASRSRTRPEQRSYGYSPNSVGKRKGSGARRRAQSTTVPTRVSTAVSSSQEQLLDAEQPGAVESLLQDCITKLRSSDWEEICSGFSKIQIATQEAPSQVKCVLRKIIWSGLGHFSSSRTKVSRSACQCFKKLFETQRRWMEGEGDKIFVKLLDLCGGPANKFIQEESKEALIAAVQNMDGYKCLQLIEQNGAKHRNGNVKEFSACLLGKIIDKVQVDKVMMSREYAQKVVPMIVGFLKEGQLNTRLHAKECLGKIFNHREFNTVLNRYVSPENIRHVNDTLKKFRGGTSGGSLIAEKRFSRLSLS